jgi:hypothetical protein
MILGFRLSASIRIFTRTSEVVFHIVLCCVPLIGGEAGASCSVCLYGIVLVLC